MQDSKLRIFCARRRAAHLVDPIRMIEQNPIASARDRTSSPSTINPVFSCTRSSGRPPTFAVQSRGIQIAQVALFSPMSLRYKVS